MSTSESSTARRTVSLPTARVLIGSVYALCVLVLVAVFAVEIPFSDKDPFRSEGPIDSMIGVSILGTAALVIGVGLGLWLVQRAERARIGAIVFGALSVLTMVVFWSGAPGIFGAVAAWLAGLTKNGQPQPGAARVAGIVGVFVAIVNVVLTVGGLVLSWFAGDVG